MTSTQKPDNILPNNFASAKLHLSAIDKLRLVDRISASPHLNKSVRLTELLRYLVEQSINEPAEGLREQEIGANIFGREEDYDTSQDNIVRVQVSQLRKKLVAYFSLEGESEPVLIEIPRGGYLPIFVERRSEPTIDLLEPIRSERHRRLVWLTRLLLLTTILFFGLSIWLWRRPASPPPPLQRPLPGGPAVRALWRALFNNERQTDLVLADSTLTILEDQAGRTLRLDEVLQRRFAEALPSTLSEAERKQILSIVGRRYTSFADVELVGKILRTVQFDLHEPSLTIARQYQMRLFKNNNVILLGSKRSNPWVELVEPGMNFQFHYPDGQPNPIIINRMPRGGEQSSYQPLSDGVGFSVVALLANPNHSGHILLLEGDNAVSTEAAGEFVSSEDHLSRFFAAIGYSPSSDPSSSGDPTPPLFEVLLQTEKLQGATRSFRIVSYRLPGKLD
ncbi:MAG: helix-turn-helix domain-containing protein [Acidobacteriota bacterium]